MWDRWTSRDALREGLGQRGGGSENGPPERQQAMVAGHGVGAPMVDRLDPGGEQPFSSIRSPAPPTRRTSTPTGSRSPGSCASPGASPAVRRTYSKDWDDVFPTSWPRAPERSTGPGVTGATHAVKRARHNSYRGPLSKTLVRGRLGHLATERILLGSQVVGAAARHPSSAASNVSHSRLSARDLLRRPDRVSTHSEQLEGRSPGQLLPLWPAAGSIRPI